MERPYWLTVMLVLWKVSLVLKDFLRLFHGVGRGFQNRETSLLVFRQLERRSGFGSGPVERRFVISDPLT